MRSVSARLTAPGRGLAGYGFGARPYSYSPRNNPTILVNNASKKFSTALTGLTGFPKLQRQAGLSRHICCWRLMNNALRRCGAMVVRWTGLLQSR